MPRFERRLVTEAEILGYLGYETRMRLTKVVGEG